MLNAYPLADYLFNYFAQGWLQFRALSLGGRRDHLPPKNQFCMRADFQLFTGLDILSFLIDPSLTHVQSLSEVFFTLQFAHSPNVVSHGADARLSWLECRRSRFNLFDE